jgi:hypothetical protein
MLSLEPPSGLWADYGQLLPNLSGKVAEIRKQFLDGRGKRG